MTEKNLIGFIHGRTNRKTRGRDHCKMVDKTVILQRHCKKVTRDGFGFMSQIVTNRIRLTYD